MVKVFVQKHDVIGNNAVTLSTKVQNHGVANQE